MDSLINSKERREDDINDINLNAFFNEGPDLKIVEIEQKIYIENEEYVDHIENNLILPDQQVWNVWFKKMHICILTFIVAWDPKPGE